MAYSAPFGAEISWNLSLGRAFLHLAHDMTSDESHRSLLTALELSAVITHGVPIRVNVQKPLIWEAIVIMMDRDWWRGIAFVG